jgi:hypothetical protein
MTGNMKKAKNMNKTTERKDIKSAAEEKNRQM